MRSFSYWFVGLLLLGTALCVPAKTAETLPGKATEESLLIPARKLFATRDYADAERWFRLYLDAFPRGQAREEALLFRGRSFLALAMEATGKAPDAKYLQEARRIFEALLRDFPTGELRLETNYWLGRLYLSLASFQPTPQAQVDHYKKAADFFDVVRHFVIQEALDYDARLYRAVAYQGIGRADRSTDAYRKAIEALGDLVQSYPPSSRRPSGEGRPLPELLLMECLLQTHQYDRVEEEAEAFLKAAPDSSALPQVELWRGESLYYAGRPEAAIRAYDRARQDKAALLAVKLDAALGIGWSSVRLAATESAKRSQWLKDASEAFRQALELMEAIGSPDPRRAPALIQLAEAEIELGRPAEALGRLGEALAQPNSRLEASYLAGQAALNAKNYILANRYFHLTGLLCTRAGNPELWVSTLQALARIERERGRPECALLYCQSASRAMEAEGEGRLLPEILLEEAASRLELAESIHARAPPDRMDTMYNASALLLLATRRPESIPEALSNLSLSHRAMALRQAKPEAIVEEAVRTLDRLLDEHSDRVRLDALFYERGRCLAALGRYAADAMVGADSGPTLGDAICQEVLRRFSLAEEAFQRSLSANPRGGWAASALFALGSALYEAGEFALRAADRFAAQRNPGMMDLYRDIAQKYFVRAPEPLMESASLGGDPEAVRQARFLLGRVYGKLERYGPAQNAFLSLYDDPSLSGTLRIDTARALADILCKRARLEEAVEYLAPYLAQDRSAILDAGGIYEKLAEPEKARAAYLSVARLAPPAGSEEEDRQAEALYRAHSLGLELAPSRDDPAALAQRSIEGLRSIAAAYPRTPWAAQALATLGRYYMEKENYASALEVSRQGEALFAGLAPGEEGRAFPAESRQEMVLLTATVLLAEARAQFQAGETSGGEALLEKALARLDDAGTMAVFSEHGERLRGEALLERARALLLKSENAPEAVEKARLRVEALRQYAIVYSTFSEDAELSDAALFEAADCYRKIGRLEKAEAILAEAHDIPRASARIRETRLAEPAPAEASYPSRPNRSSTEESGP
ncbi:MAG: tetratricopeptide repeat protein [Planctomycetota bacterium]